MTLPTITYGAKWQTDCDDTSTWTIDDGASTATLTVDNGTIFNINVTISAGAKSVYCEHNFTDFSSTGYNRILLFYKCSNSNIKAKATVFLTGAGEEIVLPETNSTDWTLASDTITSGDTAEKIRVYATQSTGSVYFHWIMIYKGVFTFPDFKRFRGHFPIKSPSLGVFGSDTNVTQLGGRDNVEFTIEGTMQAGETWGSKTGAQADSTVQTYGEYLYMVLRERKFQWFTSDLGNFKVTVDAPGFDFEQNDSSGQQRTFVLHFREYDAGDTSATTFDDPVWYGEGLT